MFRKDPEAIKIRPYRVISGAALGGSPFTFIFCGIQIIGASRASIVSTLEPAVTALLGYFLAEKLTAVQMAGGALILLGVFLQGRDTGH